MMIKLVSNFVVAMVIGIPLAIWLHAPWYASLSIGVAAYCLAAASTRQP